MANEFGLGFDLMSPAEGPPFPRSMGIYWPWFRPPVEKVIVPPAEVIPEEEEAAPYVPPYYPPAAAAPVITIIQPPREVPAAPYVPPEPVEGPTVADLRFEDMRISPSTVQVGKPVEVVVLGKNIGDAAGSERITCELDGIVQDRTVSLRPGESRFVVFSFIPKEPGDYSILVGGLVGRLKVLGVPVPEVPTPRVPVPTPTVPEVPTEAPPAPRIPAPAAISEPIAREIAAKRVVGEPGWRETEIAYLASITGTSQRQVDAWVAEGGLQHARAMLTTLSKKMKETPFVEVVKVSKLREELAALRSFIVTSGRQPTAEERREITRLTKEIDIAERGG